MIAANRVNPRLALFVALLLTALPAPTAAASFSELIKRGFEMLQSQRFEEAVENFGGALAAEPASEPARKGLAAAWAAIGVSHQRAGRLRQSRDALEQAVAARPESAEYHLLLAQILFREGDLRTARRETDRVL
jgi:tetratricopeptide (TPR) repeat protein